MQVRSLEYQTDLDILSLSAQIDDRGDYLRVLSPQQPTFYWGNLLLFSSPPEEGDFEAWTDLFRQEFAHAPRVRHITLAWDGRDGDVGNVDEFLADGFDLQRSTSLVAGSFHPSPVANTQVTVEPLHSDAHWQAHVELQALSDDQGHEPTAHLAFCRDRVVVQRSLVEAGLAHWFGAFLDGELAASCGIVVRGGRGRFQDVATHPDFRRRGICSRLVYEVARHGRDRHGAERLVIVAELDSAAARIYQSLGFEPAERSAGLCKWRHLEHP